MKGYSIWKLLVTFCENILTNRNMTLVDIDDSIDKLAMLSSYVYDEYVINKIAQFYRKKLR